MHRKYWYALAAPVWLASTVAQAAEPEDLKAILKEVREMKQVYETRIQSLETRIKTLSQKQGKSKIIEAPVSADTRSKGNGFNPSISAIVVGTAASFSRAASEIAGFGAGEEGERGNEGLSLGETELNFSANIDDKFFGSVTAAIVREDGADKVELEEAYFQTLPGAGLPEGFRLKAGRAFWSMGYLNEHHQHADDFVDRPLTHRIFLNNSFNDDGVEVSYVLPTDTYAELGGGAFRGDDFPFGGSESGLGGWSAFGRIGGDVGDNQSWRLGAYTLQGDVNARLSNEDAITFTGQSNLYAVDLRYTLAPTGNASQQEITLQGEYFHRFEDGEYNVGNGLVSFDDDAGGWYAQAVYKFAPAWRIGARYSRMYAPDAAVGLVGSDLDAAGHDPDAFAIMGDWTNSEYGRLRLQYNREALANDRTDNQFFLQYVMSIGAHGAHPY
ncbi:MAG: hypothetical protein ACJAU6_000117 [Alphaproteobacteria bacterium]|jgi:hypothetical protein